MKTLESLKVRPRSDKATHDKKKYETSTEAENFSLSHVLDGQKDLRKKSETIQETLLTATIIQKNLKKGTCLLNDLKTP